MSMILRTRCSPMPPAAAAAPRRPRASGDRRLVLAASVCAACLLGCSQTALKSMTCLSIADYERVRRKEVEGHTEHERRLWRRIDREGNDKINTLRQEMVPISNDVADLKIRLARLEASRGWLDKLVTSLLGEAEPSDADRIKALERYLQSLRETAGTSTTEE